MTAETPLVFVSCGQYCEAERELGKQICVLLKELRPDVNPYFAEDQSTVEGLSSQILRALYRSAGFICVMHRRGDLLTPDAKKIIRGSVWVEQEIAVTAFMNHVLGRSIPTLFYREVGISLEGIRSVLLMNPRVEFTHESQVLADLKAVLPSTVFNHFSDYDLAAVLDYRRVRISNDQHVARVLSSRVS